MRFRNKKRERKIIINILWIGLIISLIGLISTIIISAIFGDKFFNIALGIMAIGFLILFFGFILSRLQKLGIDYFVTGAIISYIGYILVAIPSILYAFNVQLFVKDFWNFFLICAGLILIIFGFFSETYELNRKLVKLFNQLGQSIKRLLSKINWEIVFSPLNFLSTVGVTLILLAVFQAIPPISNKYSYYFIIGGSLIGLNIIILFKEEVVSIVLTLSKIILTLSRAIGRGLKQVPRIIADLSVWIYHASIKAAKVIGRGIKYVLIHNYFLLFGLGIIIFFVTKPLTFEIRIALSFLICIIALIKPLVDQRERIGRRVNSARLYLYQKSQIPKKIFKRTIACPHCSHPVPIGASYCPRCGKALVKCYICNLNISKNEAVSICPNCNNFYHYNHLATWVKLKGTCPICKNKISKVVKIQ
ncbi:MAG: double zinc ribbon domain-containing protein [Candidatus Heimdallarchaeaceae archaeon]